MKRPVLRYTNRSKEGILHSQKVLKQNERKFYMVFIHTIGNIGVR